MSPVSSPPHDQSSDDGPGDSDRADAIADRDMSQRSAAIRLAQETAKADDLHHDGGMPSSIADSEEPIEEKLDRCQQIVEYQFKDLSLLQAALTHASGAAHRLANNERLEFLGDSILGLVVCEWLYQEYPEYSEGDLTKIKSSVVSRRSCGKIACELRLDECLIVGKGINRGRSFPRSLVSDVFEAVVAAIYIDGGFDTVRDRLRKWLAAEVRMAVEGRGSGNFKSLLQQYAQRERASTPFYRLVTESGPDHRKRFRVSAVIAGEEFQPAWGNNKKDAEQHAAANALAILHKEPPPFE